MSIQSFLWYPVEFGRLEQAGFTVCNLTCLLPMHFFGLTSSSIWLLLHWKNVTHAVTVLKPSCPLGLSISLLIWAVHVHVKFVMSHLSSNFDASPPVSQAWEYKFLIQCNKAYAYRKLPLPGIPFNDTPRGGNFPFHRMQGMAWEHYC